jgi:hypothetical protein
VLVFF